MKFLKYMYLEYMKDDLGYLSAQTSYFLLLSFIPFLNFLLTIMGSLNLPADDIYAYLHSILPAQTYVSVSNILSEVLETDTINMISLLLTLFFATKGVRAIVIAINKAYCEEENRSLFHLIFLSFTFTLTFVFILVFTLFALVFGKVIGEVVFDYFQLHEEFLTIWEYLRYTISMISMVFVFSFIYKRAPSCKNYKLKIKDVLIGAIFSTITWTLSSTVFAFYVNNFNTSYSSLYGSLGGIFALLIWLYLSSIIIILGGEINSYLYKSKNGML